jgi:hypothetical protein
MITTNSQRKQNFRIIELIIKLIAFLRNDFETYVTKYFCLLYFKSPLNLDLFPASNAVNNLSPHMYTPHCRFLEKELKQGKYIHDM